MRKLSVVLVIAALLCISTSAMAEEYQKSNGQNAIVGQAHQKTSRNAVVGFTGYIKEVYTTTSPDIGDLYNKSAVKVFQYGSTVHLLVRFALTGTDSYTTYAMVTNAGGDVVHIDVLSSSGQNPVNEFLWPGPATGSYFLTALIFDNSTGEILSATSPFPFIVE